MSAPTVVFVNDGRARLLRLEDDGAVELARVDVSGMREADVLTLMLNIAQSFNGTGVRAPAPKPSGIMSTMPRPTASRAPAAKRAAPTRRNRADTLRQFRATVRRQPGITRADLIRALGYQTNPSGTMWRELVDEAGVRSVKDGVGRGAPVRYFPAEDEANGGAA